MRYVFGILKASALVLVLGVLQGCIPSSAEGNGSSGDVDGFFDAGSVGEIGGAPITFTPPTFDFGAVAVSTDTEDTTIVLTNTSRLSLEIDDINEASDHFTIVSENCSTLTSGASCNLTIRFAPQTAGYLATTLVVNYTAQETSLSVATGVSGTGAGQLTFAGLESIDQVTATTVRLNWTHDANAANYFVFSMNGGVPTLVDTLPAPTATYTVTGLTPATGYSFRVRAQDLLGNIGTNTNDVAVTTDSPPVLTDLDDLNFPSDYKEAGELVALDVNNVNNGGPGNDTFMSYACVFDTNADGAVNAGTDCANLPGTLNLANLATQGIVNWTPDGTAFGAYEIKITGTYSGLTDDEIVVVDVRQSYTQTQLALDFDAQFADLTRPGANPLALWDTLINGTVQASLNGFDYNATSGWLGDGSVAEPFRLNFDGVNDYVDFGAGLGANAQLFVGAWIYPRDVNAANAALLGNGGGTGNGFLIRQSGTNPGKVNLLLGSNASVNDQSTEVLADSPVAYWRLNEGSGTADNLGSLGSAVDGNYNGGTSSASTMVNDDGDATQFNGTNAYVSFPDSAQINLNTVQRRSLELWFNADDTTGVQCLYEEGGTSNGVGIYLDGGTLYCQVWSESNGWGGTGDPGGTKYQSASITANTSYHVVLTMDSVADELLCYLNGVSMGPAVTGIGDIAAHSGNISVGNSVDGYYIHSGSRGAGDYFQGRVDEVAVYNSVLSPARVLAHYNPSQPQCTSAGSIRDGKWSFLGFSFDGTQGKLFINGHQSCAVTATSGFSPAAQNLQAGRDPATGGNYWNGDLAHLLLYDQSPTGDAAADQVNLYNATRDRFPVPQPTDVANLAAWFNAEGGVTYDGSNLVSQWSDLSGNGHHATQGTAGDQPTYISSAINGYPALEFDGSSDQLYITGNPISGGQDRTVFIVSKADTITSNSPLFVLGDSTNSGQAWVLTPEVGIRVYGNIIFNLSNGTTDYRITTVDHHPNNEGADGGNTTSDTRVWVDGVQAGVSSEDQATINTQGPALIGGADAWGGGNRWFNGRIAEIIVYSIQLSDGDRQYVEQYLADKYGISLP